MGEREGMGEREESCCVANSSLVTQAASRRINVRIFMAFLVPSLKVLEGGRGGVNGLCFYTMLMSKLYFYITLALLLS